MQFIMMNINDFSERNDEGATIRDGAALIAISFDSKPIETGERAGRLAIYEEGEEIDSCQVIIGKDGRVRQRNPDDFYRAVELFEVMRRKAGVRA